MQIFYKPNLNVLFSFKHGEVNCIIATDVVDEGIDIPTCTLIIRYDLPYDFRSYIQSKGRARHSTSQYSIMVPKDDTDFPQRFDKFQSMERNLKHVSWKDIFFKFWCNQVWFIYNILQHFTSFFKVIYNYLILFLVVAGKDWIQRDADRRGDEGGPVCNWHCSLQNHQQRWSSYENHRTDGNWFTQQILRQSFHV